MVHMQMWLKDIRYKILDRIVFSMHRQRDKMLAFVFVHHVLHIQKEMNDYAI